VDGASLCSLWNIEKNTATCYAPRNYKEKIQLGIGELSTPRLSIANTVPVKDSALLKASSNI
jgi:hypothetical protein